MTIFNSYVSSPEANFLHSVESTAPLVPLNEVEYMFQKNGYTSVLLWRLPHMKDFALYLPDQLKLGFDGLTTEAKHYSMLVWICSISY